MNEKPKIGIGLVRVSTAAQAGKDRASIPAQYDSIDDIKKRKDIDVLRIYELSDVSGAYVLDNPQYRAFLEACEDPRITHVITREMSRLMRPENISDYVILGKLQERRLILEFPNQTLDLSNRNDCFSAIVSAGAAGLERGNIKDNTERSKERMRHDGRVPQGENTLPRGFGYRKEAKWGVEVDPKTRERKPAFLKEGWYIDEEEMRSVRLLFKLFLGGNHVYEQLAKLTGISRGSITTILRNPIYKGTRVIDQRQDSTKAGLVLSKKPKRPNPDGNPKKWRRKVQREKPIIKELPAEVERIITPEEHAYVLQIVDQKRRHRSSARPSETPFTYGGYLFCGLCRRPVYTWTNSTKRLYYHCKANSPRYRAQGLRCGLPSMSARLLEPRIDEEIVRHLGNPQFIRTVLEDHFAKQRSQGPDLEDLLKAQFEALEAKRKREIALFENGIIEMIDLQEKLRDIDQEIAVVSKTPRPVPAKKIDTKVIVQSVCQAFYEFDMLSLADKRDILQRTVPAIHVEHYRVAGVELRIGRNNTGCSTAVSIDTTSSQSLPTLDNQTIYVPFDASLVSGEALKV
jgi:DNA invertase Pin-like site-specific DNA recombinase